MCRSASATRWKCSTATASTTRWPMPSPAATGLRTGSSGRCARRCCAPARKKASGAERLPVDDDPAQSSRLCRNKRDIGGKMRHLQYFAGALLALLWVSAPALAVGDHDAVLAPIHQFVEALNKGDMKAAAATHTAAPSIIDDVPPHQWQGADAFDKWSSSDVAEMQKD